MESGRSAAYKGCDTHDALVLADHVFQRVSDCCGTLDSGAERQVDLYGKLVAVSDRHHLLRYLEEHQATDDESANTNADGSPRMTEAPCQQDLVILVHHIEQVEGLLAVLRFNGFDGFLDEKVLQDLFEQYALAQKVYNSIGTNFEERYDSFCTTLDYDLNEQLWNTVELADVENLTDTPGFSEIYAKYFGTSSLGKDKAVENAAEDGR